MITRLISHFTKPNDTPAILRQRYGAISGGMGFILNLLLFLGKFLAGQITGSMAITVDAFNNLSDAGSSVVTFIGFRMANQRPDASHPFGHGRIEYLSGLFVSVAILFVGLELIKTSIGKIFTPEIPIWSILSIVILVISIFIKLWMFFLTVLWGR